MRNKTGRIIVAACCAVLFTTNTWAESSWAENVWNRDKLTGDWGGLRTDLIKDHGVDLEVRYSSFYQNVTSGGVDTGHAYANKVDSWLNIDMNKLFGTWKGLSISAHMETRHGDDVLDDAGAFVLPNAALMFPLPGDYHGNQVTGLTVSQTLFDGKAAIMGGKLQAFDLLQGFFPNTVDYGLDGFMNANSMMSILSWGRWLTLSQYGVAGWTVEHEMPSSGFIVAGSENTTTTWSMTDSFSDGFGIMLFHRFVYAIDGKMGYVYVAPGWSTRNYPSTEPVDWTAHPGEGLESTKNKKPWSFALYVYQIFWQQEGNDKRFAHVFMGGSISDDNPSFADWDVFANIQAFGPFEARPHDRMGVAYHYYHIADDFDELVSDVPGKNLRSNTWTTELFYNIEINRWLHLTPNLQYAQNENESDDPAVIVGTRLVVDF
jgi:porin